MGSSQLQFSVRCAINLFFPFDLLGQRPVLNPNIAMPPWCAWSVKHPFICSPSPQWKVGLDPDGNGLFFSHRDHDLCRGDNSHQNVASAVQTSHQCTCSCPFIRHVSHYATLVAPPDLLKVFPYVVLSLGPKSPSHVPHSGDSTGQGMCRGS